MSRKPSRREPLAVSAAVRAGRARSLSDAELDGVSAGRGTSLKATLPDPCKTPAPPSPLPTPYPNT